METSSDLSEVIVQFRARLATNTQLISLLSTSARDVRIKRSIDLIEDITLYGGRVSTSAQEILKVCENDSVRHRGLHQPLSLLKSNLSEATDHIMESVKRILLYLEHFKVLDSKAPLPQSTYELTQSTITQQQQLAAQICSTACSNIASSSIKPPGPVPMPYQDSVVTELVSSRDHGLFLLEPRAIGDAYDARWDPNHKVPGTQHGKFLRFPGPFYGPPQEIQGSFDQFCLPEATGILIDSTTEDYEDVKANFESTERLQTRDNEDDGKEFAGLQEVGIFHVRLYLLWLTFFAESRNFSCEGFWRILRFRFNCRKSDLSALFFDSNNFFSSTPASAHVTICPRRAPTCRPTGRRSGAAEQATEFGSLRI